MSKTNKDFDLTTNCGKLPKMSKEEEMKKEIEETEKDRDNYVDFYECSKCMVHYLKSRICDCGKRTNKFWILKPHIRERLLELKAQLKGFQEGKAEALKEINDISETEREFGKQEARQDEIKFLEEMKENVSYPWKDEINKRLQELKTK
jgi:hypothetical protein